MSERIDSELWTHARVQVRPASAGLFACSTPATAGTAPVDGTHHHVSKEHLERYLAQFDFLRTWCETDDSDRMRGLLNQVGGRRLTYKPLTEG